MLLFQEGSEEVCLAELSFSQQLSVAISTSQHRIQVPSTCVKYITLAQWIKHCSVCREKPVSNPAVEQFSFISKTVVVTIRMGVFTIVTIL